LWPEYFADVHIHSHYSMTTSKECDPVNLARWAALKGLRLVGTGDFTHPAWRAELREALAPAEDGFFRLKDGLAPEAYNVRFVLSGEISSIYKKNGKTRKVHQLVILPGFAEADAFSKRLAELGNIRSDGRPIVGVPSKDLLEMALSVSPRAIFIPAHIWTPHFSVLGAKSGFDSLEECYEDLTEEIFAVETGLSSDPAMNRRLTALDRYTLVSNSDAHSPANLAREANLLRCEFSYEGFYRALRTGEGFAGTVEFFPEEGKYHLDGHRRCGVRFLPEETRAAGGRCPVCGRPVTTGVLHRVVELADRDAAQARERAGYYERLIPLATLIAGVLGRGKRGQKAYEALVREFGSELAVLREAPREALGTVVDPRLAEAIVLARTGQLEIEPGYDGEYGRVRVKVD